MYKDPLGLNNFGTVIKNGDAYDALIDVSNEINDETVYIIA